MTTQGAKDQKIAAFGSSYTNNRPNRCFSPQLLDLFEQVQRQGIAALAVLIVPNRRPSR